MSIDPYGVCPQGWKERPGSDTCYLITTRDAKTFDDARKTCRLQQGDLLVVDDVQEAVRKINFKNHSRDFWDFLFTCVILSQSFPFFWHFRHGLSRNLTA